VSTYPYHAEHLFTFTASLSPDYEIIKTANKLRTIVYVTGGSVSGPKVFGKVRPVGADWCFVRPDGVLNLDVRLTMETDDGALIYVTYGGTLDYGPNGYEEISRGNYPPASAIFTTPVLETAHPDYLWLNRLTCFGIGRTTPEGVQYDVYGLYSEV